MTGRNTAMELTPGSTVDGRYEIVSLIGEGGMGIVYKARHKDLDRMVALKVLRIASTMSEQQVGRFRREAQILDTLRHPGIVEVFNSGITDDGSPYIAMELVDGAPLNHLIETTGGLEYRKALRLFIQICDSLQFAHAQDIVHRDIKPGNLLILNTRDGLSAKIIDFGVARFLTDAGQALTRTGAIVGSVRYMSPEQLKSANADKRADVYSLGCTLFETISGKCAFDGETYFATVQAHLEDNPPLLSGVRPDLELPPSLGLVLRKMMDVDPAQRYQDCGEVKDALQGLLNGKTFNASDFAPVSNVGAKRKFPKLAKEHWMVFGAGILILVPSAWVVSEMFTESRPQPKVEANYWQRSSVAEKAKQYAIALDNINKALESAQKDGDQAEISEAYRRRAKIYQKWAHEFLEKGDQPTDAVHLKYIDNAIADSQTAIDIAKGLHFQAPVGLKKEVYALAELRGNLQLCQSLNSLRRNREAAEHFEEVLALAEESANRVEPEDLKEVGFYVNRCIERAIKNGHEKSAMDLIEKEREFLKRHALDVRLEQVREKNAAWMRVELGDAAADRVLRLYAPGAK